MAGTIRNTQQCITQYMHTYTGSQINTTSYTAMQAQTEEARVSPLHLWSVIMFGLVN